MVAQNTHAKYLDEAHRVLNFLDRSIEPEVGDRGLAAMACTIKSIDKARHAVHAVLSSDDEDRYGEVVDPRGFEPHMANFRSNPQLLYAHDHLANIGHWEKMTITKHTLEGWAVFDDNDEEAMKIFRKYEGGHMFAFSVGFIAREFVMEEVGEGKDRRMRRRFISCEPLEGSACTVPANPAALSKAFGQGADERTPKTQTTNQLKTSELDYAALAKALREGGLDTMIQSVLSKQINKVLTDPVGPVDIRMREVIAAVLADDGSCGHYKDVVLPPSEQANDQLAQALKSIAGA